MVRGQQITLLSLTRGSFSRPESQGEYEAVNHFKQQQKLVQELELEYLNLCCSTESDKESRDGARKLCIDSQERLDTLRTRYRKVLPNCRYFMTESEAASLPPEEIMFRPNVQDFVEGMEADVKELAALLGCDWKSLLPKALGDLERAWHAAERTSQPVGLTWHEVRTAVVQKFHSALR